jgi:D-alanyl-lipoteichoic acid acyltransferase DltB (MBOAT superfamily)
VLFNSYAFVFVFLPATLTGCFLLARLAGPTSAQFWLIAASLLFYASWSPRYLPLLIGSILFNYLIASRMVQMPEGKRGALMAAGIAVDIGLLAYYKYTNFFIDTVNLLSGSQLFVAQILLPLGISFYTFQQITLLVDLSGGAPGKVRLRDFALFVMFFPHLIAGPIVHHSARVIASNGKTWRSAPPCSPPVCSRKRCWRTASRPACYRSISTRTAATR